MNDDQPVSNLDTDLLDLPDQVMRYLGLSPVLIKATCTPAWDYTIGLRDGNVFQFNAAHLVSREWIHLDGVKEHSLTGKTEHGVDVRIKDIVWVADGNS